MGNEKVTLLYGKEDLKYVQATSACKLGHLGCQVESANDYESRSSPV